MGVAFPDGVLDVVLLTVFGPLGVYPVYFEGHQPELFEIVGLRILKKYILFILL